MSSDRSLYLTAPIALARPAPKMRFTAALYRSIDSSVGVGGTSRSAVASLALLASGEWRVASEDG